MKKGRQECRNEGRKQARKDGRNDTYSHEKKECTERNDLWKRGKEGSCGGTDALWIIECPDFKKHEKSH